MGLFPGHLKPQAPIFQNEQGLSLGPTGATALQTQYVGLLGSYICP